MQNPILILYSPGSCHFYLRYSYITITLLESSKSDARLNETVRALFQGLPRHTCPLLQGFRTHFFDGARFSQFFQIPDISQIFAPRPRKSEFFFVDINRSTFENNRNEPLQEWAVIIGALETHGRELGQSLPRERPTVSSPGVKSPRVGRKSKIEEKHAIEVGFSRTFGLTPPFLQHTDALVSPHNCSTGRPCNTDIPEI